MSLSDSRLSSFSLYPWNPGMASSIFSCRLVWDFARSKYGLVVELKFRPCLISKSEFSSDSLLRVSKPESQKNRNEILSLSIILPRSTRTVRILIGKTRNDPKSGYSPRSRLAEERLQNDYVD